MMKGKKLRRLIAAMLTVGTMLASSVGDAEVRTYEGVDEYVMSDFELPDVAKQRAKQRAIRNAQEKAGVFVRSHSTFENYEITEDEIITMTASVVRLVAEKISLVPVDDNTIKYVANVRVNIDTDEIDRWLSLEAPARYNLTEQNKALRQKLEEQDHMLDELKGQVGEAQSEEAKLELEQKFNRMDNEFLALTKVWEGNRQKSHKLAINSYTEAIELNPEYAVAYYNRGVRYKSLWQYDEALADLNKSIELDPNYIGAYNDRASVHFRMEHYESALEDYNKVAEWNPNNATAYNNRGFAHRALKEYDKAIEDYSKAIELDPEFAVAYNNRGNVYVKIRDYERALADYSKAIELNPSEASMYNNRGIAYIKMKDYERALEDYNKAIELDPEDSLVYYNRGYVYRVLGDEEKAHADFEKSKELGG